MKHVSRAAPTTGNSDCRKVRLSPQVVFKLRWLLDLIAFRCACGGCVCWRVPSELAAGSNRHLVSCVTYLGAHLLQSVVLVQLSTAKCLMQESHSYSSWRIAGDKQC